MYRPLTAARLERIRWVGAASFRALGYYFSVRWNRWTCGPVGEYVQHVFGPFAVEPDPSELRNPPTPGLPRRYSLVQLGPSTERRYRILLGTETMLAVDTPGEVLEHLVWNVNAETMRHTGSFVLVHAGVVQAPDGLGVVMPGHSGAGKSTLTAGLVRAGFGYLSDEAAAIDPVSRRLYPYPRVLTLKGSHFHERNPDLRGRFDGSPLVRDKWHLLPDDLRPGGTGSICDTGYVVVPRYQADARTVVIPMSRAAAVMELGQSLMNGVHYRTRALPVLADVVRGAECFSLVSGDIDEAVAAVRRIANVSG